MWLLWIKAVHILAVISFMAGLLYLPRLMVYHTQTAVGSDEDRRFQIMERRLLKAIINPASIVTVLTGLWLAWEMGYWDLSAGNFWLWSKLAGVAGLLVVHALLARHMRAFAAGKRLHGETYYRVLNEVPTLLMVVAVILVVVKPF
jgi:putative membrane protein